MKTLRIPQTIVAAQSALYHCLAEFSGHDYDACSLFGHTAKWRNGWVANHNLQDCEFIFEEHQDAHPTFFCKAKANFTPKGEKKSQPLQLRAVCKVNEIADGNICTVVDGWVLTNKRDEPFRYHIEERFEDGVFFIDPTKTKSKAAFPPTLIKFEKFK